MKSRVVLAIAVTVMFLLPVGHAYALDGYDYYVPIDITNGSDAEITGRMVFTVNAAGLIDGYYMQGDADDVRLTDGTTEHFMAGNLSALAASWYTDRITVPANSVVRRNLWMGNDTATLDQEWIADAADTVTVTDDPSLDITGNLTISADVNIATIPAGDAYILNKSGAYWLKVGGNDTLTAGINGRALGTTSEAQLVYTDPQIMASNGYHADGQRIEDFVSGNVTSITITSMKFYLRKVVAPTGTLYARIRKTSDKSLIGTLGSVDVSTLDAAFGWVTFNSSPVEITDADVLFLAEYQGSLYPDNYVDFGINKADATRGYQYYQDDGDLWHGNAGWDSMFDMDYTTYMAADREVSTTVSEDTDYSVKATYDGTTLRLYLGGVEQDAFAFAGNITANANNVVLLDFDGKVDDLMLGNTSVAAPTWNLNLQFEPDQISSDTISDQSASSNDASFTLAGNPAGITVTVYELTAASVAEATAATTETVTGLFTTAPPEPTNFYPATDDWGNLPGADLLEDLTTASGAEASERIPLGFVWLATIAFGLVAIGYFIYHHSKHTLPVAIIVTVALVFCAATIPSFGFWMLAPYLIVAISALISERQYGY